MEENLKVVITAEINQLKEQIGQAKNEIKGFEGKAKEGFKKFGEHAKKGVEIGKAAMKGAIGVIGAVAGAIVGVVASTAEYREGQAKLKTAFESAGSTAEQAKETYNGLYRVLGDSDVAVEAASHLAKLTTDQQSLSEWTNICQGVYATFGDSLPIESLTEAANETAKTGELTGALADALNWAGISEEDFAKEIDDCNTEAEREKLIREKLNRVYQDASKKYEANNKEAIKQKEAQAKLQDALARVGTALQPIITMFTNLATEVLTRATPYIEKFATKILPKLKEWLGQAVEAVKKLIDKFVEIKTKVSDAMETMKTKVKNAVDKVKGFLDFEWSLPQIKLPHFSVSGGQAPWGFGGKGSLPKISVDWYAKGGVFDKPTLFGGLGEAGAEAIVPLENNLEWLDNLRGC